MAGGVKGTNHGNEGKGEKKNRREIRGRKNERRNNGVTKTMPCPTEIPSLPSLPLPLADLSGTKHWHPCPLMPWQVKAVGGFFGKMITATTVRSRVFLYSVMLRYLDGHPPCLSVPAARLPDRFIAPVPIYRLAISCLSCSLECPVCIPFHIHLVPACHSHVSFPLNSKHSQLNLVLNSWY